MFLSDEHLSIRLTKFPKSSTPGSNESTIKKWLEFAVNMYDQNFLVMKLHVTASMGVIIVIVL